MQWSLSWSTRSAINFEGQNVPLDIDEIFESNLLHSNQIEVGPVEDAAPVVIVASQSAQAGAQAKDPATHVLRNFSSSPCRSFQPLSTGGKRGVVTKAEVRMQSFGPNH